MGVMQVPIVKVIHVSIMLDGRVTAARAVDVVVGFVGFAIGHGS